MRHLRGRRASTHHLCPGVRQLRFPVGAVGFPSDAGYAAGAGPYLEVPARRRMVIAGCESCGRHQEPGRSWLPGEGNVRPRPRIITTIPASEPLRGSRDTAPMGVSPPAVCMPRTEAACRTAVVMQREQMGRAACTVSAAPPHPCQRPSTPELILTHCLRAVYDGSQIWSRPPAQPAPCAHTLPDLAEHLRQCLQAARGAVNGSGWSMMLYCPHEPIPPPSPPPPAAPEPCPQLTPPPAP